MSGNEDRKTTGMVFNIQKFSVHDGPGIRTVVFLKGCPMRCRWCSNPESQNSESELAYNKRLCLGTEQCGRCVAVCPKSAITASENGKIRIHREHCNDCPCDCAKVCPIQCLTVYGMASTVDSVLAVVEKDASFYARSGGGMTLSGGEPLLQRDFTLALLREAKCRHIDTSMETCGFVPWKDLHDACTYLDSVLFDIKILDPEKHFAQTGVPLKPVLENFRKMMQTFPELCVHVRTPVVPDFNDSKDVLLPIAELVRRYPNARHELLPYHRLGTQKYMFLGREYLLGEKTLDADLFRQFNRMYRN